MSVARQRTGPLAAITWLFAVSTTALVVWSTPPAGDLTLAVYELGLIFAAYALGARAIACRLHDWGTFALAILGLGFGFWFPLLNQHAGPQFNEAISLIPSLTGHWRDALTLPAVIASAGTITAAATYLVTRSGGVFLNIVALSLVASLAPLFPDKALATRIAVVLWHAGVAATVCHWGLLAARRASGVACPFCGSDLIGLSSPVCPTCRHRLPAMCKLPGRRAA